jgi:WS/DGAT/MGAT family acyltransferase
MTNMFLALIRTSPRTDGTHVALTFDYLRAHMAERLDELPSFRWRIVRVPLGLHHPVAVEDPDFVLDRHLQRTTLSPPGGTKELDRLCATLAETPLDRRHPLWQLTLIDGLADGRQAVVLKAHHCLMDGVAAMTTLSRVFSGEDHVVTPRSTPWRGEPIPRRTRSVLDAIRDHRQTGRRLQRLIRTTARNIRALNEHDRHSRVKAPRSPADVPPCSLNDAFTASRVLCHAELPLAHVLLVKDVAGVTLNDVALAIVAGALRHYLSIRGDLPTRPLVAGVPFSLEPPNASPRQFGNRLTKLSTSLGTDIADPWERLHVISAVSTAAKQSLTIGGAELLPEWLDCVPPFIAEAVVRFQHRRRRAHRERADANTTISNLRGPTSALWLGPAQVEGLYIFGPPNNGVGSVITLWSYAGHLSFGILAFADSLRSPGEFVDSLHASLSELLDIARRRRGDAGLAS